MVPEKDDKAMCSTSPMYRLETGEPMAHVSACRSPLYILEVGGLQAEVQHGADLGGWWGCYLWKVIVQKKAVMNSLDGFGGRDACQEGDDIAEYHGLLWLKFEMANLFSKVLGVLDVVWGVAKHGSQDGGQVFGNIVFHRIDAAYYWLNYPNGKQ